MSFVLLCIWCLNVLQAEREQRYALKKELDTKNNSESMYQLGNLALSIQGMPESGAHSSMGSEGDEEAPVFKKMEEGEEGEEGEHAEDSAPAEDLFSEIHLGQLKKLEKQLESSESEKLNLGFSIKELQTNFENITKDAAVQRAKVAELLAYTASLVKLSDDENSRLAAVDISKINDTSATLEKHRGWQTKCVKELESLKQNLKHFKIEDQPTFDSVTRMKNELSELKDQLQMQEKAMSDLNHDVKIMESLSVESQTVLGQTQNDLGNVTEELAKIYHHICTANNITPSRVMLEHSKGKKRSLEIYIFLYQSIQQVHYSKLL